MKRKPYTIGARYVVDGQSIATFTAVYTRARTMGFKGSPATLHRRLSVGANTWEQLCAPLCPNHDRGAEIAKHYAQSRAEMHEMCMAIDARKAEMV